MKPIEAAGVVVMGLEKNSHLDHISLDLGTHATYHLRQHVQLHESRRPKFRDSDYLTRKTVPGNARHSLFFIYGPSQIRSR